MRGSFRRHETNETAAAAEDGEVRAIGGFWWVMARLGLSLEGLAAGFWLGAWHGASTEPVESGGK